jgi:hypothetical protein
VKKHYIGGFESQKFESRRADFYAYRDYLQEQKISTADWMEHFPAYIGHMALNRALTLYEYYKLVKGVAGHIAEIGVYKGAGTLMFAKLVRIFESESLTQVHGFDWFQGTGKGSGNDTGLVPEGGYQSDEELLMKIIEMQGLNDIVRIHNFDLTKNLQNFMTAYKHLQFKLCFMDAGMYEVMSASIPLFWERLTPGGIMIFDQFSHELGPGETIAIRELLPGVRIQTLPNSWMPNAYAIKE